MQPRFGYLITAKVNVAKFVALTGIKMQMHKSLLNASLSRVSAAKAVVANPTHISIALDYEPGKYDLPYVLAMGVDEDALRIRETAKQYGIPVIVNVKLARMIYQDCEEDEYIKKDHLVLAAEVFRAVLQLSKGEAPPAHPDSAGDNLQPPY